MRSDIIYIYVQKVICLNQIFWYDISMHWPMASISKRKLFWNSFNFLKIKKFNRLILFLHLLEYATFTLSWAPDYIFWKKYCLSCQCFVKNMKKNNCIFVNMVADRWASRQILPSLLSQRENFLNISIDFNLSEKLAGCLVSAWSFSLNLQKDTYI